MIDSQMPARKINQKASKKNWSKKILMAVGLGLLLNFLFLVVGVRYSVPDLSYDAYGFPFKWLVHLTGTIRGPADSWNFVLLEFLIDFAVWVFISFATVILLYKRKILKN